MSSNDRKTLPQIESGLKTELRNHTDTSPIAVRAAMLQNRSQQIVILFLVTNAEYITVDKFSWKRMLTP